MSKQNVVSEHIMKIQYIEENKNLQEKDAKRADERCRREWRRERSRETR